MLLTNAKLLRFSRCPLAAALWVVVAAGAASFADDATTATDAARPAESPPAADTAAEANTTEANTTEASSSGLPAAAPSEPSAEPVTLRYQFHPGEELRYVSNDETSFEVLHSDSETTVKYSTKAWKHYRVTNVHADGNVDLELFLDHVHMRAEGDGNTIEYDSRLPGAAPAEFAHLPIGGAVATITVSPVGKLLKYEEKSAAASDSQLQNTATIERDLQVLTILPEDPVQVGDRWRELFDAVVKLEGKLTRKVRLQRLYTLQSVIDGVATIELQTIVLTPLSNPEEEAQIIQKTPSGVLQVDLARGVILSKRTQLHNQVVGFSGPSSRLSVDRVVTEQLTSSADSLVGQSP